MADFDPGPELEALLGARRVAELRQLAAAAPRRASGRRVFILPGIMGSTLGAARKLLPDDLLWFDPVEIALGRLTDLVPPARRRLEARGALLFGYLRLKLLLRATGHDATILPYDWRHSVRTAAAALARRLATAPEGPAPGAHPQGGPRGQKAGQRAHAQQLGPLHLAQQAAAGAHRTHHRVFTRPALAGGADGGKQHHQASGQGEAEEKLHRADHLVQHLLHLRQAG